MALPPEFPTTRTNSGLPIVIYTEAAGGDYPVHGAYYNGEEWVMSAWTAEGKKFVDIASHALDLVYL